MQEQAWIPPDGCQDLVGIALPGGPVQWHVYALSPQAETIALPAGARLCGFRLAPGTQVDTKALLQRTHALDLDDGQQAMALLADTCTLDARVEESLQALVHAPSVTQAARNLQRQGVIDYRRGRLVLLDRRLLERTACECYAAIRERYGDVARYRFALRDTFIVSSAEGAKRVVINAGDDT